MAQTRLLTEYRLRPILRRGGIAAPRGDSFCVYRGRDTRYQLVGWVSPHIIGRLRREGQLSAPEDFPERIIWRRGASPDPLPLIRRRTARCPATNYGKTDWN